MSAVFGFSLAAGRHLLRGDVSKSRAAHWREGVRRMLKVELSGHKHLTNEVRQAPRVFSRALCVGMAAHVSRPFLFVLVQQDPTRCFSGNPLSYSDM